MEDDPGVRRSFLGRRVPPWFELRAVRIPVGAAIAYVEGEWRDAIVLIERGEIELETFEGERHRFGRGSLIWLDGVRLHALRNAGPRPAELVAISRPAQRGP
jgi:hypothetical protein